ncbi:beta-fructofuranosidase, insoluble isoenzyme 4-like [Iris pallida]|uniref:Beta-fructofuranosidase, insoluble isoenzyme 4-like n=1 Tax=Iris pallida TaxID=29817 RepID=A0AAX6IB68_IRIPA|nr:beta-fructofuranosidase, insoluble isoenzyme 4-like [Iris pallida]
MASSCLPSFAWIFALFFFFFFSDRIDVVKASRRIFKNPDSAETGSITSTKYRTAYHFQPPQHWINDPNGPMYYNGIYHLFYQYNPYAAVWGNISWGHSVSTDLVRWTGVGLAIAPTEPYEANGCWSGSATILPGNKPVILYTSSNARKEQVQNVAYPKNLSDPFLREWTKPDHNPIIEPAVDLNASEFRDPTTGWLGEDGLWRVLVGNKIGAGGRAILYRSKDFVHWVRAKDPLSYSSGSGMWECPDFFPSDGGNKYVLKMSLDDTRTDHYMLGSYDKVKDLFVPDGEFVDYRRWPRYDYGNFYASKTFFDEGKGRRILWGWSNESDSVSDDIAKGWAGIQTIPRVVWLDKRRRQLLQWPVEELESLRRKHVRLHDVELGTGGLVEVKGLKVLQASGC